jgi:polyribonucleotide nucleotidyltransferase
VAIAVGANGQPVVTWIETSLAGDMLHAQRWTGAAWEMQGSPVLLANAGVATQIQLTGGGTLIGYSTDTSFALRSFDAGTQTWQVATGGYSQAGITGIQLDLKIAGISREIIKATLGQSREARMEILRNMITAIRRPRAEISGHAPRLLRTQINPEKIGLLIGPGGKTIRAIQESTGANIEVQDDGTVTVAAHDGESALAALAKVEALTASIQIGRIYEGRVTSVKDFGAFVELVPGKDGLCHISELSDEYVASVNDVCQVGDVMRVKVIAVDDQDRVKLSRRAAMRELAEENGEAKDAVEAESTDE